MPEVLEKEIEPGFKIEVSKCDPVDLNQETYLAARRVSVEDNVFVHTSIEKLRPESKSSRSHTDVVLDDIAYLVDKEIIDTRIANILKWRYTSGYPSTSNIGGVNMPQWNNNVVYPPDDNPYQYTRYTLFKLFMTNESKDVKNLQLSNLIVSSGTEQLYPLSIKYFDTVYAPTTNRYQNILRFNLPDEIQVPPGKSVVKYFAVPIINETNQELSVTFNRPGKITTFDFKREAIYSGGTFNYRYFSIVPKTFFTTPAMTVIVEIDDHLFVLKNPEKMFVYEQDLAKPVSVFCFCESGLEFEFGKVENVILSQVKKDKIFIKMKGYRN